MKAILVIIVDAAVMTLLLRAHFARAQAILGRGKMATEDACPVGGGNVEVELASTPSLTLNGGPFHRAAVRRLQLVGVASPCLTVLAWTMALSSFGSGACAGSDVGAADVVIAGAISRSHVRLRQRTQGWDLQQFGHLAYVY